VAEPSPESKRGKLRDPIVVGLVVAILGGLGTSWAVGLIGPKTGGSSTVIREGSGGGETSTGGSEAEVQPGASTAVVVEYADNRAGSPVFADPTGGPVEGAGRIPYGTEVEVSCFARNESGMASVSGFYRIASGKWKGNYVVADTMTNGGEVGETDTPNVDGRVPRCGGEE
jgi:hypothetical protein